MALWDTIKKEAVEGLEALKEGVALFVAEAGKQSKILKKKVEISSVQNNVRRAFTRLGSLVYDVYSRGEQDVFGRPEVRSLIDQIEGYKVRVREIELEIEVIKKEEGAEGTKEEGPKVFTRSAEPITKEPPPPPAGPGAP